MSRLLVLIASTRPSRVGGAVGSWVISHARERAAFDVHVADLRDLRLPLMDEPRHPKAHDYANEHTLRWSETVQAADAFVFVMPEYNHSFTAPLKNAIDYLYHEWAGKPVGLVSYGGLAGGTRAVVELQPVLANLGMSGVRSNVEIAWVEQRIESDGFRSDERLDATLEKQLDELESAVARLRMPGEPTSTAVV